MKNINLYNRYNQPYNNTYYAYFDSECGNHHVEYVDMTQDMLVKIAKRLTINYKETKKLDLSFMITHKLLFLEELVIGYASIQKLVVTEILSVYLWKEIFKIIDTDEYIIEANIKRYYSSCDIDYIIKNYEDGIQIEAGVNMKNIPLTPIVFCKEFIVTARSYMWYDIYHDIDTEFKLWLNQDPDLIERYLSRKI